MFEPRLGTMLYTPSSWSTLCRVKISTSLWLLSNSQMIEPLLTFVSNTVSIQSFDSPVLGMSRIWISQFILTLIFSLPWGHMVRAMEGGQWVWSSCSSSLCSPAPTIYSTCTKLGWEMKGRGSEKWWGAGKIPMWLGGFFGLLRTGRWLKWSPCWIDLTTNRQNFWLKLC